MSASSDQPPSGRSNLPERGRDLPERRLTTEQFELVIRRATELQARASDAGGTDGITEAEALKIGRELGLSGTQLSQALAEVRRQAVSTPPGMLDRWIGEGAVEAFRTVPGDADKVLEHLERYMVARERLSVVRRGAGRILLQPARGMDLVQVIDLASALGRLNEREPMVGAGFKLKRARQVEASVQQLEEGFGHVTLRVDLSTQRNGAAAGAAVAGVGVSGVAATFLGIAVDPLAAAVGIPLLLAPLWPARAMYGNTREHAQLHLESILDCLERGEPLVSPARARR